MDLIAEGEEPSSALSKASGTYGRYSDGKEFINPRKE
jgi:hypothetical protein